MAGAVVATKLTEEFTSRLAEKFFQEVWLVTSFSEDFKYISAEIDSIKLLLKDAGERRNSSSMSSWFEKLEDFLEDALYLVDECKEARNYRNPFLRSRNFRNPIFRYRMGRKIRILKERIGAIHGSAKYIEYLSLASVPALNDRAVNKSEAIREKSNALIGEFETVGLKEEIKEVTNNILKEGDPKVIAVVGMGGQGKTLLVGSAFKSQKVQEHFHQLVWLDVSQNYDVEHLLRDMAKEIKPPIGTNESVDLKAEIHDRLDAKRCLFVLDNVWQIDILNQFMSLLRECQGPREDQTFRNKIVITTRNKGIPEGIKIIHKRDLSIEDSLKLFCIHAFPDRPDHTLPKELENDARQIVEKCSKLPLAVKAVARSIGSVPNYWERTLHSLNIIGAMSDDIQPSLRLSYEALPEHLKACFLYCSIFPKNSKIESQHLVYAWIAQDFICKQESAEEAYELGCSYLEELIDRCLIEVSNIGGDGRAESCKMHDLLHDLAVLESPRKIKCLIKPGEQLKKLPVEECEGLRRISLMKNEISTIKEAIDCPRLRTLSLSCNRNLKSISASFFKSLIYLSVLDLSETSITFLPKSIGNLKYLKFLNLSQTMVKKLPKSLSGLKRLQFLDVSKCQRLKSLHSGIGKHQFMLYLNLEDAQESVFSSVGWSQLTSLQTLKTRVFLTTETEDLQMEYLKELILIQHLSLTISNDQSSESAIYNDQSSETESSESAIKLKNGALGSMTKMRTISFRNESGKRLHLPEDMHAMKRLESVRLYKCVVPEWIFHLQWLMDLNLCGDNTSSYKGIERIPNLRKLHLVDNKECVEFPKEFGGPAAFPKLKELLVKSFGRLESFPPLQKGAMPKLKCLQFLKCDKLTNMPEGFERLASIEEVKVDIYINNLQEAENLRNAHCWQILRDRRVNKRLTMHVRCV